MRKTFLISQLACISVLFAPEGDNHPRSDSISVSNGSWVLHGQNDAQSEAGSRYSFPVSQLNQSSEAGSGEAPSVDNLDSIMFNRWYGDYFKTQEVDGVSYFIKMTNAGHIRFRLSEMGANAEVSEVSAVVPGVVEDTFKAGSPDHRRSTRFKYTTRRNIQCSEVKHILESLVYQIRSIRDRMIKGLNEACEYGYQNRLPLDNIEIQDVDNVFYLICGIAQEGPVKYPFIKEPESIRIQLKLPLNCPECYMDRNFLGIYHRIYSSINQGLIRSLTGVSKFSRVEGYVEIPDILKKQTCWTDIRETISYLVEDELEPIIHIPTYQHNALIDNSYALLPFKHKNDNLFTTERVHGLQYSLDVEGLDAGFMLSDVADKEISRLQISYKGESDTEFVYDVTTKIPGSMVRDTFKDMLPKLRDLESKFALSQPTSSVKIREEQDTRYLDVVIDANVPRLQIKLSENETGTEYLTQENLSLCRKLDAELKQILGPDVESTDVYVEVPEVLKKQVFWDDTQTALNTIGNASILIQQTQRDALIDKGYELLTFTHDEDNVFKTEVVDDLVYSVSISDTDGSFKLSDLADKEVTGLSIDMSSRAFRYSIDKTISGSDLGAVFKGALRQARKVRNDSILANFPLEMVSVEETSMTILASHEGIKLNPKFDGSEGPQLQIQLSEGDVVEKFLTEERLAQCRDACELVRDQVKELLKDVTEFNDNNEYVNIPQVLQKQTFWPEAEGILKQIADNVSVQIPSYLREALIDKGYELLTFTHWYDYCNGNKFKTEVADDLSYIVQVADKQGLDNRFKLSDLMNKKNFNLWANVYAPAPGKFKQSSGDTEFTYIITFIAGNQVRNQFKIGLQNARKLRDDSIAQLSKIQSIEFPLAWVFSSGKQLLITPSDEGKKLHPKWTEEPEAAQVVIKMTEGDAVEKFLTEEKLVKSRDVSNLVTKNVNALLAGVTKFSDKGGFYYVPNSIKNQAFWRQADILLKQIDNSAQVGLPGYQVDALEAKFGK